MSSAEQQKVKKYRPKDNEKPLRKYKKPLPVEMDEKQFRKLGEEAGELGKQIEEKEAKLAKLTKGKKKEIQDDIDRRDTILESLRTGTEEQDVKVSDYGNFESNEVHVVRDDTLEIVETRTMSAAEKQNEITAAKKDGDKTDKPAN